MPTQALELQKREVEWTVMALLARRGGRAIKIMTEELGGGVLKVGGEGSRGGGKGWRLEGFAYRVECKVWWWSGWKGVARSRAENRRTIYSGHISLDRYLKVEYYVRPMSAKHLTMMKVGIYVIARCLADIVRTYIRHVSGINVRLISFTGFQLRTGSLSHPPQHLTLHLAREWSCWRVLRWDECGI